MLKGISTQNKPYFVLKVKSREGKQERKKRWKRGFKWKTLNDFPKIFIFFHRKIWIHFDWYGKFYWSFFIFLIIFWFRFRIPITNLCRFSKKRSKNQSKLFASFHFFFFFFFFLTLDENSKLCCAVRLNVPVRRVGITFPSIFLFINICWRVLKRSSGKRKLIIELVLMERNDILYWLINETREGDGVHFNRESNIDIFLLFPNQRLKLTVLE